MLPPRYDVRSARDLQCVPDPPAPGKGSAVGLPGGNAIVTVLHLCVQQCTAALPS